MRMTLRVLPIVLAICVGFVALPRKASASTLMGDVISGSYNYPCSTCTYTGNFWYSTNPFVVTNAVESTLNLGNQIYYSSWSVDFGPNTLLLTMVPAPNPYVTYTPAPFNGQVFTVLSGYVFSSVTGVNTNNPDCIPCTPVTAFVLGDSLFVNWQGAGGQVGDTVQVNFTVSDNVVTAIPEPSTWAMLLIGFAGIGAMAYRRKHFLLATTTHLASRPKRHEIGHCDL
jgi:PEP-CTERM motif